MAKSYVEQIKAASADLPKASQRALLELITMQVATVVPVAPPARTLFTKKQRAKNPNAGYPCTAGCSRRLGTQDRAALHAQTGVELLTQGHAPEVNGQIVALPRV